jgi:hypothetical protein
MPVIAGTEPQAVAGEPTTDAPGRLRAAGMRRQLREAEPSRHRGALLSRVGLDFGGLAALTR